jgi:hypothetical protein
VEKYLCCALAAFQNRLSLSWNQLLVSLNNSCGLSGIKDQDFRYSSETYFAGGGVQGAGYG